MIGTMLGPQLLPVNYQLAIGTIDNVNTPFNGKQYKQVTEINVIDPKHPLFGSQFSVLSFCKHASHGDCAIVKYQHGTTLRIPLSATDLGHTPLASPNKLSSLALEMLISLAKECQLICQPNNPISGGVYPPINSKPSSKI